MHHDDAWFSVPHDCAFLPLSLYKKEKIINFGDLWQKCDRTLLVSGNQEVTKSLVFRAVFLQFFHDFGGESRYVEIPLAEQQPIRIHLVVTD